MDILDVVEDICNMYRKGKQFLNSRTKDDISIISCLNK